MPKYESDKDIIVISSNKPGKLRFEIEDNSSVRWFELTHEEAAFLFNRIREKLEMLEMLDGKDFDYVP